MVARGCGRTLEHTWVVGDRAETDIADAVAIGARSICIHRRLTWTEDAFVPSFTVNSAAEVPRLVLA
jgi:FMN phosphatase YigB (HAD superfamily)